MTFPVKNFKLSAEYWMSRPLSTKYDDRDHPHAAWDLAAPISTVITAPEDGSLSGFAVLRADKTRTMDELDMTNRSFGLKNHHYFYDIYGGVIVFRGKSGLTHIFTHTFLNQLHGKIVRPELFETIESPKMERFPLVAISSMNRPIPKMEGQVIGYIGNAGYSTGPHAHYEVHDGGAYAGPFSGNRIDPAVLWPRVWDRHKGDDMGYDWKTEKKRWEGKHG